MKVIVTSCSKDKNEAEGLLPASSRCTALRVRKVYSIAIEEKIPLFFISGKFGLIPSDHEIPYYDHQLLSGEVDTLLKIVTSQMKASDITGVTFYAYERKENRIPYYELVEKSTALLGIPLQIILL